MIEVRNKIISKLYAHIQRPIIHSAQTENYPDYPYCEYSIISHITEGEYNELIPLDIDVEDKLHTQNKFTLSFSFCGVDDAESYSLAEKARYYLKHIGAQELSYEDITVVDVTEIINRAVLRTDAYEVRYGFDAVIRYANEIDRVDNEISEYSSSGVVTAIDYAKLLNELMDTVDDIIDSISALNTGKQNKLTFDDAPVAGSDNPVKSGGIHDALTSKMDYNELENRPRINSVELINNVTFPDLGMESIENDIINNLF